MPVVNPRRSTNGNGSRESASTADMPRQVLDEPSFLKMISLERKRAERSHKSFLLMLLDAGEPLPPYINGALGRILSALSLATRETDVTGWYKTDTVVGAMFTEIEAGDRSSITSTILTRISESLGSHLTFEQLRQISISFHFFPEDWQQNAPNGLSDPTFYPELFKRKNARRVLSIMKRVIDLLGSVLALTFCLPLILVVATAIKLTSKGPVFFRQQRIGQYGVPFVFLKFRSMYVNNDSRIHQEYVRELIAGRAAQHGANGNGQGVYKLTRDERITKLGSFLRRTSLDELPQFVNVLRGDMSLVGPRPPLPYEVEAYDIWHRRRVLEAKPGITGLWQVSGRNRIAFDEMVRLDLRYARAWNLWLDLKILLQTPKAMAEGAH